MPGPNVGRIVMFNCQTNQAGCGGEGTFGIVVADIQNDPNNITRRIYVKADNCVCGGPFQGGSCNGFSYGTHGTPYFVWAEESYVGKKVKLARIIGLKTCGGPGIIATVSEVSESYGEDIIDVYLYADNCVCNRSFRGGCDGLPYNKKTMKSIHFEWVDSPSPNKVPAGELAKGMRGFITEEGKFWAVEIPELALYTQGTSLENAYEMAGDAIECLVDRKDFKVDIVPKGDGEFEVVSSNKARLDRLKHRRQRMMEKVKV